MSDLLTLLQQAPHHLLVRLETLHLPSESDLNQGKTLAQLDGLVADAPRSRRTADHPAFEPGDTITFFLEHCVPEDRPELHAPGVPHVFSHLLHERALVEVILDERLYVLEGLIEPVDDHSEDPRYNEFGAFHG